jgi:hypothetical protein
MIGYRSRSKIICQTTITPRKTGRDASAIRALHIMSVCGLEMNSYSVKWEKVQPAPLIKRDVSVQIVRSGRSWDSKNPTIASGVRRSNRNNPDPPGSLPGKITVSGSTSYCPFLMIPGSDHSNSCIHFCCWMTGNGGRSKGLPGLIIPCGLGLSNSFSLGNCFDKRLCG